MGADECADLRPLLICTDSAVMLAAAHVVGELRHTHPSHPIDHAGKMVLIAGPNLGESWFTKEIGQAIVLLEGEHGIS